MTPSTGAQCRAIKGWNFATGEEFFFFKEALLAFTSRISYLSKQRKRAALRPPGGGDGAAGDALTVSGRVDPPGGWITGTIIMVQVTTNGVFLFCFQALTNVTDGNRTTTCWERDGAAAMDKL